MSIATRFWELTADDDGLALEQAAIGIVEVIAVAWEAGTAGPAIVEVSESDIPFLTIGAEGTYRPTVALHDELGQELEQVAPPFTLSGQILMGLSNGTPGGTGVLTVTYRR